MKMIDEALRYAKAGIPVFPLHWLKQDGTCSCRLGAMCQAKGKHPRIKNWGDEATVKALTDAFLNGFHHRAGELAVRADLNEQMRNTRIIAKRTVVLLRNFRIFQRRGKAPVRQFILLGLHRASIRFFLIGAERRACPYQRIADQLNNSLIHRYASLS